MAIGREGQRDSRLRTCLDAAHHHHLDPGQAADLIDDQVEVIAQQWDEAADAARLTRAERTLLRGRQVLNPSIRYGYGGAG